MRLCMYSQVSVDGRQAAHVLPVLMLLRVNALTICRLWHGHGWNKLGLGSCAIGRVICDDRCFLIL